MISTLGAALHAYDDDQVVVDELTRTWTARELRAAIRLDGEWLERMDVGRCALSADNGWAWVVADLGLHLKSIPCVPLPAAFSPDQCTHAINDAGVDAVLTDDPYGFSRDRARWRCAGTAPGSGLALLRRRVDRDALARLPVGTTKITYTSGSTGTPKGVCLSARQLEDVAMSLVTATKSLQLRRHLCLLPLTTLLENVAGVLAPLLSGSSCVIPSSARTGVGAQRVDVPALLGVIACARPDSLVLVPELLRRLVLAAESGWQAPETLRFVAVGGATVAPTLLDRAELAGFPVYEGYGLSECASVVCLNTPEARRLGSVGKPLPHARLRIDSSGEIHVTGSTMLGYVGGDARNAGAEYATGDLGHVDDDGFVYVHGRRRNVFISSLGRNVSPEWVEAELSQQPGIAQAFVHGESRPYPVALIVPVQPDVDAIVIQHAVDAANARLPAYACVRRWARLTRAFTANDGLLTANGRLRRGAIEERYAYELADLDQGCGVSSVQ